MLRLDRLGGRGGRNCAGRTKKGPSQAPFPGTGTPPPLGGEIEAFRLLLSRCILGEAGNPKLPVEQQPGDGLALVVLAHAARVAGEPRLQALGVLGPPPAQPRELPLPRLLMIGSPSVS